MAVSVSYPIDIMVLLSFFFSCLLPFYFNEVQEFY